MKASMRTEFIDTLIIGGGQAGLAMSHMLGQRGCPNIVVERQRIAERWRTERWDGLRFQNPNWSIQLPNFPFPYVDPDAFATSDEIVRYLTAYARFVGASVRCGVNVQSLRRRDSSIGFVAETSEGRIEAANVVVASGPYQRPKIPPLLSNNATVFQVHASRYRRPEQLPPGAVLVIGSGASGVQSPKNSFVRVERFISRSGGTVECRAVIVAAILSGGYRPSDWTRHLWRSAGQTVHCHWSPVLMAVTPSTSDSWLRKA